MSKGERAGTTLLLLCFLLVGFIAHYTTIHYTIHIINIPRQAGYCETTGETGVSIKLVSMKNEGKEAAQISYYYNGKRRQFTQAQK